MDQATSTREVLEAIEVKDGERAVWEVLRTEQKEENESREVAERPAGEVISGRGHERVVGWLKDKTVGFMQNVVPLIPLPVYELIDDGFIAAGGLAMTIAHNIHSLQGFLG